MGLGEILVRLVIIIIGLLGLVLVLFAGVEPRDDEKESEEYGCAAWYFLGGFILLSLAFLWFVNLCKVLVAKGARTKMAWLGVVLLIISLTSVAFFPSKDTVMPIDPMQHNGRKIVEHIMQHRESGMDKVISTLEESGFNLDGWVIDPTGRVLHGEIGSGTIAPVIKSRMKFNGQFMCIYADGHVQFSDK